MGFGAGGGLWGGGLGGVEGLELRGVEFGGALGMGGWCGGDLGFKGSLG